MKKLNKSYNNSKVLENVSFSIKEGSITSIVGSNGSGKSTLLRSLLRLIEPDSGDIYFLDMEITKIKKRNLEKLDRKLVLYFKNII